MPEFKYFVIYSKGEQMERQNDALLTYNDVLDMMAKFPHMKSMTVEHGFNELLRKWNTEQTHPTVRYFYGPL